MEVVDKEGDRVIIKVWDVPTRLLHWVNASLVIVLILLMLSNDGMEMLGVEESVRDSVMQFHAYAGHLLILTFSLRILWGFFGNTYAGWGDIRPFNSGFRQGVVGSIRWYLGGCKSKAVKYIGHDPLASVFYIGLVLVLFTMAITGVLLSGIEFKLFPGTLFTGSFSAAAAKGISHALMEVHESGFFFIVFFIAAHIVGLVIHEVKEKTGLLSSMVHGRKYLDRNDLK